jgi:hypothetical protein
MLRAELFRKGNRKAKALRPAENDDNAHSHKNAYSYFCIYITTFVVLSIATSEYIFGKHNRDCFMNTRAMHEWSPHRQEPVAPSNNATSRNCELATARLSSLARVSAFHPRREPGDAKARDCLFLRKCAIFNPWPTTSTIFSIRGPLR